MNFGTLFKRFLLKSEFATLSEFGDVLASHGYIFDDSTFSRWQHGNRIPKSRTLLLLVLQIFIQRGGIVSFTDANDFMESAGQGYLTQLEAANISLSSRSPFQAPQRIAYFTGRNSYLQHIQKLLQKHTSVFIHGPPGIGKTALVIHLCYQLRNQYPDGILWCRLDTSSVMDILAMIAHTYGENLNHIKNVESRASVVRSLLVQKKFLLILDNAELHHDLRLLLPNAPRASVVITSRYKNLGNPLSYQSVALDVFTQRESLALFRNILGSSYIKDNRRELITVSVLVGHLPLAVNLFAKQLTHTSQNIANLIHQLKKEGVPLEELTYEDKNLSCTLDYTYKHLSPTITKVFSSLGVFEGRDFSLPAIAFLHGLSTEKTERLMGQLVNSSLVEYSTKGRYRIHSFIKQFIQSNLLIFDGAYENIATYYEQFLDRGGRGVTKFYPAIEQELENILGVFSACYQRKQYRHVIELWEYLGVFLWDTGRWNQMIPLGKLVLTAAEKVKDWSAYASCYIRELCWLFFWQGDIVEAKKYATRGLIIAKRIRNRYLLALARQRLGMVYQKEKKFRIAERLLKKAQDEFSQRNDQTKVADTELYLGHVIRQLHNRRKAYYYYQKSLQHCLNQRDQEGAAIAMYYLGELYVEDKEYRKAEYYFLQALKINKERKRKAGVGWTTWGLALVAKAEGNRTKARQLFEEARIIFEQLRIKTQAEEAKKHLQLLSIS